MVLLASLLSSISSWTIAFLLLIGIAVLYLTGAKIGNFQKRKNPEAKADGLGPLEGALLGLLALLLSFTFGMSASRYDERRSLIIEEANNIGTVTLLADMYPDSLRNEFKKDLQQYVEARIVYHKVGIDEEKISKSIADATKISGRIWQRAVLFSQTSPKVLPHTLMVPALNNMIDIVTSREAARQARVPDSIIWLLFILCLLGSFIIGYSKKETKNDWIVLTIYSLMTGITIYTVIDLDRPRQGLIKTDLANEKIIELRSLFDK